MAKKHVTKSPRWKFTGWQRLGRVRLDDGVMVADPTHAAAFDMSSVEKDGEVVLNEAGQTAVLIARVTPGEYIVEARFKCSPRAPLAGYPFKEIAEIRVRFIDDETGKSLAEND